MDLGRKQGKARNKFCFSNNPKPNSTQKCFNLNFADLDNNAMKQKILYIYFLYIYTSYWEFRIILDT